jgi:N-acetylglucosamine kinase-like BadF-type ATPase
MAAMTRNWTVGVDAGGTWLRVLATDGRGRRRLVRAPASPDLRAALGAVWRRWRLGRTGVAHLVVATRGIWTAAERRAAAASLRGLARRVTVISDAEAAHHGALGGRPGLLVLAGTGSIVLGRGARGRWVRAGGLGPLFGDGGSAFALGRDWLAAARPSRARRLARDPHAVARIAALAPRVLGLARRGQGSARFAVARGAFALALAMRAAAEASRLSPPISVSWAGRLLEDRAYRSQVWRMARGLGLEIAPVAPRESALEAVARLASGRAR